MPMKESVMFLIENDAIGLRQYTHDDDYNMYLCWKDIDTQKGYNGIFDRSFEEFKEFDINRFKFWVTVTDKETNESVGVLRLGLGELPDLAIWIYPQYRNQGYGTQSFILALTYLFTHFEYPEISAGCYETNTASLKMLKKIGFERFPSEDQEEIDCFTGKITIQLEFRISKDKIL